MFRIVDAQNMDFRFFSGFLTASRLLRKICGCMHFDLLFDRISNWSMTSATLAANMYIVQQEL